MIKSFQKILVPVDLTQNTDIAIKKAIELIDSSNGAIHLLHIHQTSAEAKNEIEIKLSVIREKILAEIEEVDVVVEVVYSDKVESTIIEKAKELMPDLIIISKKKLYKWFPFFKTVTPGTIAEQTCCPVLTVKPGCLDEKTKLIVVPVAEFIPNKKIEVIAALCKRFRLRVHLVTIINEKDHKSDFSAPALVETYRHLKSLFNCSVEYKVLHGDDAAKATLDYAEKVDADMMLVNTRSESKLKSFLKKEITDIVSPDSKVQVLTI